MGKKRALACALLGYPDTNMPPSLTERIVSAWVDETRFDMRRVVGRAVSHVLPHFAFNRTRTVVLRAMGLRIGEGSRVMGPLDLTGPGDARELFSIGEATFVSGPLHVDLGAAVRIGSRVQLGHHVVLLTIEHEIGPAEDRCGKLRSLPITIGDGVWIATRVTVLPGVTIGAGSVVAAGAVVTRDVAPNTLVAGVPARVVRKLPAHGADRNDYGRDSDGLGGSGVNSDRGAASQTLA
jgi:maltose O-acetyltransferase